VLLYSLRLGLLVLCGLGFCFGFGCGGGFGLFSFGFGVVFFFPVVGSLSQSVLRYLGQVVQAYIVRVLLIVEFSSSGGDWTGVYRLI
jgi:hypothetical protein